MTPDQFKILWETDGESLSPIDSSELSDFKFSELTKSFLTNSGLPFDAAPYLSFVQNTNEKHNSIQRLDEYFQVDELVELNNYIVIGTDGEGNPVVINELNEEIELVNHEDLSVNFINSSLEKLTEFLLTYRDFIKEVISNNGEDAFLNSNFSDDQYQELRKKFEKSDRRALKDDHFWAQELEHLISERSFYNK